MIGRGWILASIMIAMVSLGLPAQASVTLQVGGGGAPALATKGAPSPSVRAQASLVGGGSSGMPQGPGTGCDPGDSFALPGWACLGLGDQFRDYPQGMGPLGNVGSILAAVQSPVTAQGQAPGSAEDQERWVFAFTPYIWLPTSATALNVGPFSTSFSVGPFQGSPFGAMLHFDAMKGKWGYFLDAVYLNVFFGSLGPFGNTSVLTTAWLGELAASYRLGGPNAADLTSSWGTVQNPPTYDVYFGIKVFSVTESLTVNFPLLGPLNATRSVTAGAPMVGLRARWDLNEKWSVLADVNVDGLGAGATYIFGYGAIVAVSYKLEAFQLPAAVSIGARIDYLNVQSGDLGINQTLYGPLVGFTVFW